MAAFLSTKLGKVLAGIGILFVAGTAWLFVSDARHQGMINAGKNDLRSIWRGLQNYDNAKGQVPPAVYRDADGKPLSSWRFQLIPYMESFEHRFDLKGAWDSPANSSIRQRPAFGFDVGGFVRGQWQGEPLRMSAIGVDGKWAMDSGKALKDLPGKTLLAISAPIKQTHWMEPSEVDLRRPYAKNVTVGSALGITRSDVVYLLFADGRAEVISSATPLTEIEQYLPALD